MSRPPVLPPVFAAVTMLSFENEVLASLAVASAVGLACGFRPFLALATLAVAAAWGGGTVPPAIAPLTAATALMAIVALAAAEALSEARVWSGDAQDLLLAIVRWPIGVALVMALTPAAAGSWPWLMMPGAVVLVGCGHATQSALRALLRIVGIPGWPRRANHLITLAVPLGLWLVTLRPALGALLVAVVCAVSLPAALWQLREWRSLWRRWRQGLPESA